MKYVIRTILLFAVLSIIGCEDYHQQKLGHPNPTKYVFDFNIEDIKTAITQRLRSAGNAYTLTPIVLMDKATRKELLGNKEPENSINDYYFNGATISQIYKNDRGMGLNYQAGYIIHLQQLDTVKTEVTIYTIDPRITVGYDILPSAPDFKRKIKTIPVPASTIEEYRTLQIIGWHLGVVMQMPKMQLPENKK